MHWRANAVEKVTSAVWEFTGCEHCRLNPNSGGMVMRIGAGYTDVLATGEGKI
jgi:hypothetical protein